MTLIVIIALVAFVLCLAAVALNAIFVLKGQKPVLTLAIFGVTFLLFAVTGAAAAGLPVPVLSTLGSGGGEPDPDRFILQAEQLDAEGAVDTADLALRYGELKSITSDGAGAVEIDALVTTQKKEGMSVDQNFYNVEDLVRLHGFDNCQEIRYTGTAIVEGGGENRVISFTVGKGAIDDLALGNIEAPELRDLADSLWISTSLEA